MCYPQAQERRWRQGSTALQPMTLIFTPNKQYNSQPNGRNESSLLYLPVTVPAPQFTHSRFSPCRPCGASSLLGVRALPSCRLSWPSLGLGGRAHAIVSLSLFTSLQLSLAQLIIQLSLLKLNSAQLGSGLLNPILVSSTPFTSTQVQLKVSLTQLNSTQFNLA